MAVNASLSQLTAWLRLVYTVIAILQSQISFLMEFAGALLLIQKVEAVFKIVFLSSLKSIIGRYSIMLKSEKTLLGINLIIKS